MRDVIDAFILRNYLLFFLLPVWNVIGALDWWWHRRAGIERFGSYGPALPLVLLFLAGAPLLLGLFLDINAPILLLMVLCFLAHEAVGHADIAWASRGRGIRPFEQRVHDYLAAVPLVALSLVILLHWQELVLLFQHVIAALRQPLQFRAPPLPHGIVWIVLSLVLLRNIVPYAEEFVRTLRRRAPAPS